MSLSIDQQKTRRLYDLIRPTIGRGGTTYEEIEPGVATVIFPDFGVCIAVPFEQITLTSPIFCGSGISQYPRVPLCDTVEERLELLNRPPSTVETDMVVSVDEANRGFKILFQSYGITLQGSLDQIELAPVGTPPETPRF